MTSLFPSYCLSHFGFCTVLCIFTVPSESKPPSFFPGPQNPLKWPPHILSYVPPTLLHVVAAPHSDSASGLSNGRPPPERWGGLGSQQGLESQEGSPACRLDGPFRHRTQPGLLGNGEEAVKFAVSGFGKHRVRVSGAAGNGEGQAQLISCQDGPEAPAPLQAGHRGGDAGNGAHSSGWGRAGPRGTCRE